MTREEVEAAAFALPAVTKVVQWGASDVYKVGGKVFAICGLRGGAVVQGERDRLHGAD